MDHIDFHKILVHFQHGFRALHSCETQLLNTVEELIKGLNDKEELDLIRGFSGSHPEVGD